MLKDGSGQKAVELHVPGFFTWRLPPQRAHALAQELTWAAVDALPDPHKE